MASDENSAHQYWLNFMTKAKSAYADCRWEGAELYLNAAIDIAALRLSATENLKFTFANLLEPLSLLCQLYLSEQQYNEGLSKIAYVRSLLLKFGAPNFVDALLARFRGEMLKALESENGSGDQLLPSLVKNKSPITLH